MPTQGQLPTASPAQIIGFKAEKCFGANCPESWLATKVGGTDDFGVDYQVQVLANDQVADIFRVQLKGTTKPELIDSGSHISIQLKAPTIRYYARFTEPILLVICDLSVDPVATKCPLYYVWIHDELRRINVRELSDSQHYVNLNVPTQNVLDSATDLSQNLYQIRALSGIGTALDMTLEMQAPSLDSGARAALLEKLPSGFSARSPALIESLAEDPVTVWPDRPINSMAWCLFEAERNLSIGAFERAEDLLKMAEAKLNAAVQLEVAEYWYLKGRAHMANLAREQACDAFERAMHAEPTHPKYLTAWAETKLVTNFSEEAPRDFGEVYAKLTLPDPAVQAIKARILAAERRYVEAEKILISLSGVEQLSAQSIIYTMQSRLDDALRVSCVGLGLSNLKDSTRLLFQILKARSEFHLAIGLDPSVGKGDIRLPLSGRPGVNLLLLNEAWQSMGIALHSLRAAGWPSNIEFLADVFCATASMLDKVDEALGLLLDAADRRPALPTLQAAVESLAVQVKRLDIAMMANARQPETSATKIRRVALLHMARKDAECVSFFEANLSEFDREDPMFAEGLMAAISSADRLVKSELVKAWLELCDGKPELMQQRAVWEYFSAISRNKSRRAPALSDLFNNFERNGKPLLLAIHLFNVLNPHSRSEAEKIVAVAEVLKGNRLFDLEGLLQLGQALTTLEHWPELLQLAKDGIERFKESNILIAVAALALDRLGRTSEARELLIPLIARGVTEPFVVGTHIDIATRCGFIDEAIGAAQMMVSLAENDERRTEYLRLLHNLVCAKSPSDPRALDIAWRIGELTNRDDEAQEGAFLMMVMVSNHPQDPDPDQVAEYQERLRNYTIKFPNSNVLRAATFPDNASPDEVTEIVMRLAGDTPETLEARRRKEDRIEGEGKVIPFTWRSKIFSSLPHDLPQLWEMSKHAKGNEPRLQLSMIAGQWVAHPWEEMREKIPLMDLLSLLIAYDLQILESVFELFEQVAITQRSLRDLGRLANPLAGSAFSEKCRAIQVVLQKNFQKLRQPRATTLSEDRSVEIISTSLELKAISREAPFILYSDDAFFRIFCQEFEQSFKSICVLDVLTAMESQGVLSTKQVAEKIGLLCAWGVVIGIEQRWQVASLPDSMRDSESVAVGSDHLRNSELSIAIFNGMWDRRDLPFHEILVHGGSLVTIMLDSDDHSPMSVASLMVIWLEKAVSKSGAPPDKYATVAVLVRVAGTAAIELGVSLSVGGKIWRAYFLLMRHLRGGKLNEGDLAEMMYMIAGVAANHDLRRLQFGKMSLGAFFEKGLRIDSDARHAFSLGYKNFRKSLNKEYGMSALPGSDLRRVERPLYWKEWQRNSLSIQMSWGGRLDTFVKGALYSSNLDSANALSSNASHFRQSGVVQPVTEMQMRWVRQVAGDSEVE